MEFEDSNLTSQLADELTHDDELISTQIIDKQSNSEQQSNNGSNNKFENNTDDTNLKNNETSNHSNNQQQHLFESLQDDDCVRPVDIESQFEQQMEFNKNYSDELLGQSRVDADFPDYELTSNPNTELLSGAELTREESEERLIDDKEPSLLPSPSTPPKQSQSFLLQPQSPNLLALKTALLDSYAQYSDIFYWRKPIETGIVFAVGLFVLIAFMCFSIISVFAYSALALISFSGLMRLGRTILSALGKNTETPLDKYWDSALRFNVSISSDAAHKFIESSLSNINSTALYVKSVLLVEDKIATLKFGSFLFALTFIGAWFNGLTLATIGYVSLFTVPKLYEQNKSQIDAHLSIVSEQINKVSSQISNKISTMFGTLSSSKKQS